MASRVQAILARDVVNLGHVGDVVKVAPGYLRNFLVPQRLAMPVVVDGYVVTRPEGLMEFEQDLEKLPLAAKY